MSEETDNWYLSGNLHVDGYLGIGTKTPGFPLSVRAVGTGEELLGFEDVNGKTKWHINQNLGGNHSGLSFAETGVADGRLFLQAGGNVGIGTIEPKATLDVNGGAFLGYENTLTDFGLPLKSGFYQGVNNIIGDVPDQASGWTHLIAARHSTPSNNYQLQIAATYASNDKLYFRKIALDTTGSSNPDWHEVATRGVNSFLGNQYLEGNLTINGALITHPVDNSRAKEILTNLENGSAIVGAANGINEARIDFFFKYKDKIYKASVKGDLI